MQNIIYIFQHPESDWLEGACGVKAMGAKEVRVQTVSLVQREVAIMNEMDPDIASSLASAAWKSLDHSNQRWPGG